MKKSLFVISFVLLFIALSCKSRQPATSVSTPYATTGYEQHLLDSILQYGLDHEALYTLLTDIKPMSSLVTFYYPLANADSTKKTSWDVVDRNKQGAYLDKLYSVQQAVNKLNLPDLRFILVPYQSAQDSIRVIQLSVVRVSSLDSLLRAKESFFGQFGLVPGTDPVVVASVIENADIYERYRGYGYLFGYPDYAVDFFVDAAVESKKAKKVVPRNFFQIPVYAGDFGYFVYAYPKEHKPTSAVDSALYYRSTYVLEKYKGIRDHYINADSTLRGHQLLRELNRLKL